MLISIMLFKAHRIDFDGGQFANTTLLSDRRNLL
jgi:hypothetical protein